MMDIDALEEIYSKWDDKHKRDRFLRRMEHKLNIKERKTVPRWHEEL